MPYKTFKKYKYADRKFDSFQLLITVFCIIIFVLINNIYN